MSQKLAVKLGLREKLEKDWKNMLDDMTHKFTKEQGKFMGFRYTFVQREGFVDQPEQRKFQNVSTTVPEQLNFFRDNVEEYLTTVLSIERTNAKGVKAHLFVEGEDWGEFTTLELLRLKGILDSKLKLMVQSLPIRPETVIWRETDDATFKGREIWEDDVSKGSTKTTTKRLEIVHDPHIKDAPDRPPVSQSIDKQEETGDYTRQNFHGGVTNKERAEFELAFNELHKSVIAALEEANSAEVETSDLGTKVLDYLF